MQLFPIVRKHFDFTDPSEQYMDLNLVLRSKNLKDMCLLAATAQLTSEYGFVISHYLFTARAGLEKTKPVYFFISASCALQLVSV